MAPDIAVEVVSSGPEDVRRDRVDKLAEYAGFGIRWNWIVEPERRLIEIHELTEAGTYRVAQELSTESVAEVPGCPGLVIPMDALWAKLDELGD
jgi:Uma2 family endonuclease